MRVSYVFDGEVATITLDDGKVNALSPDMQTEIHGSLDQAEHDEARVVRIRGRSGVFSAGFDLKVIAAASEESASMVIGGFELARRLLAFPQPVLFEISGHAMAMGAFLLLSGDYRLGTTDPAKITANEVKIGMTMPYGAIELMRQRLTPAAFTRAAMLAEVFDPAGAVVAGFLDEVVEPGDLAARSDAIAQELAQLDRVAHRDTKRRVRELALVALDEAIERDRAGFSR